MLAVGQVVQEAEQDQAWIHQKTRPAAGSDAAETERPSGGGYRAGDRHEIRRGRLPEGDLGAVQAEEGDHQAAR